MTQGEAEHIPRPVAGERLGGIERQIFLTAGNIIHTSQVRKEPNAVIGELKASILKRRGLLYPIKVAHVDEAGLAEYIEFTNSLWGDAVTLDQFADARQQDGTYYMIIAGHSRYQAITELQAEGEFALDAEIPVDCMAVTGPEDILDIQMDENIHSTPPRERRAIAIVENYRYGLAKGKWTSQADFIRQHPSVGKTAISEALAFVDLPASVRDLVFGGYLSYNAGIELGKSVADCLRFVLVKSGLDEEALTPEQAASVYELAETRLRAQAHQIIQGRLNSTAAEKKVRAWRKEVLQAAFAETPEETLFGLATPEDALSEMLAAARRELTELIRAYHGLPFEAVAGIVEIAGKDLRLDVRQAIVGDVSRTAIRVQELLSA